ncbi:MAG: hypothetical protein ACREEN_09925, partial [Stellaceae bacterium]
MRCRFRHSVAGHRLAMRLAMRLAIATATATTPTAAAATTAPSPPATLVGLSRLSGRLVAGLRFRAKRLLVLDRHGLRGFVLDFLVAAAGDVAGLARQQGKGRPEAALGRWPRRAGT